MRIAVVQHVHAGDYAEYLSSLLDEAAAKENYQVKTWSTSIPAFSQMISTDAIVYIMIEPSGRFSLKWLYAVKLPSILKKLKTYTVIDLTGNSASFKIPHIAAIDQTINTENKNHGIFNVDGNANSIIVYSQRMANKLNFTNACIIRFTAPEHFRKFEWHEKIMIKAMQADNNEYFLSVLNDDAENDFMLLLRAFSIFKKWQHSSMKLLLLPKYESFENKIHEKLKTYKYRNDVKLLENLEEAQLTQVVASAHSLIQVSSNLADLMIFAVALKCGLPVITCKDDDVEEYLGAAAYYINEKSAESLGNALIGLYKDEDLQTRLKETAEKQTVFLNREEYKSQLWQLLQTAAHS